MLYILIEFAVYTPLNHSEFMLFTGKNIKLQIKPVIRIFYGPHINREMNNLDSFTRNEFYFCLAFQTGFYHFNPYLVGGRGRGGGLGNGMRRKI